MAYVQCKQSEGFVSGGNNRFFQGVAEGFYLEGTNSGDMSFYRLETKSKTFSYWKLKKKITNFKIQGVLASTPPPLPMTMIQW